MNLKKNKNFLIIIKKSFKKIKKKVNNFISKNF